MPQPARTTILLLNILGVHATPNRGAKPHCRPRRVELLTPGVACGLFPATINQSEVMESDAASYAYFEGSKLRKSPFFSVKPPIQSNRSPAVMVRLLLSWNLSWRYSPVSLERK